MQKKIIRFKHSANLGDLVACMASVKKICDDRNAKAIMYQRVGMEAFYYEGAKHPTVDDNGSNVCMNRTGLKMIKPLLKSQYYIEDVLEWNGEDVDFDLDNIRNTFVNMPYGNIQRWYGYVYPQMFCDLSYPWIEVYNNEDTITDVSNKVIINFTSRYRNNKITYYFLRYHLENLLFVGTDDEYKDFCEKYNLNIDRLVVKDFRDLMLYLNNCKFFLGNASFCFNLAEAMKIPRILEACNFSPSCTPHGSDGYEFYHQPSLEYFFKKLIGNKERVFYIQTGCDTNVLNGLGDFLMYSRLPRLLKKIGYNKVYIVPPLFRNDGIKELILLNPHIDGVSEINDDVKRVLSKQPRIDINYFHINFFNNQQNLMKYIEQSLGVYEYTDDKPEIYYNPNLIDKYKNKVIYDPNCFTNLCGVTSDKVTEYFKNNNIKVDYQLKSRDRLNASIEGVDTIETSSIYEWIDVLYSAKKTFSLFTGINALMSALDKDHNVFYCPNDPDCDKAINFNLFNNINYIKL